jgi:hypothetical protein
VITVIDELYIEAGAPEPPLSCRGGAS